jgi:hypothetical protein
MVHGFSQILTKLFDFLVLPFGNERTLALAVLSLITGVALMFLFKATSDQKKIKATRDQFKARILEMRIYQNDIVLIHKALFAALWTNLVYLRVSLKPIVVLLLFVLPVFIQFDERYGRRHLEASDHALLSVTLQEGNDPRVIPFSLQLDDGLVVDSRPVRSSASRQIHWRLVANSPGTHQMHIKVGESEYDFPVRAEKNNGTIGHTRTAGAFFDPLFHPSLPMIPAGSPIQAVTLHYPSTEYELFGWGTHWLVVFIIFSFVGALIPKFVFKIEI